MYTLVHRARSQSMRDAPEIDASAVRELRMPRKTPQDGSRHSGNRGAMWAPHHLNPKHVEKERGNAAPPALSAFDAWGFAGRHSSSAARSSALDNLERGDLTPPSPAPSSPAPRLPSTFSLSFYSVPSLKSLASFPVGEPRERGSRGGPAAGILDRDERGAFALASRSSLVGGRRLCVCTLFPLSSSSLRSAHAEVRLTLLFFCVTEKERVRSSPPRARMPPLFARLFFVGLRAPLRSFSQAPGIIIRRKGNYRRCFCCCCSSSERGKTRALSCLGSGGGGEAN